MLVSLLFCHFANSQDLSVSTFTEKHISCKDICNIFLQYFLLLQVIVLYYCLFSDCIVFAPLPSVIFGTLLLTVSFCKYTIIHNSIHMYKKAISLLTCLYNICLPLQVIVFYLDILNCRLLSLVSPSVIFGANLYPCPSFVSIP